MNSQPEDNVFLNRYYTEAENERQTYDLVIPANARGSAGLVLCIHGGGWIEGDKSSYKEDIIRISKEKHIAAAAMNYRFVSASVCFGDILDDITAALSAIRADGKSCGVSFDRVLLTGISAGGHLSLLYAYVRKDEAPIRPVCVAELCGPSDFEDSFYYSGDNSIVRAVGAEWFREIIGHGLGQKIPSGDIGPARPAMKKYSPVNHVDKDTVPTIFGHGERDEIVPYKNALDLDKKLTGAGVEHAFVTFPDSGHGCEDKGAMSGFMKLFMECVEKYLK